MIGFRQIWRSDRGAAAAEMAMVAPLLLIILIGSVETGNYFLSEHVLVKGLRDGARYAARQSFASYPACSGTAQNITGTIYDNTRLLVRKGSLNSADPDRVGNWGAAGTTFTVTMTCAASTNGQTLTGIYRNNPGGAPVILVTASVPYRPVMPVFGASNLGLSLNGTQQASVMGI